MGAKLARLGYPASFGSTLLGTKSATLLYGRSTTLFPAKSTSCWQPFQGGRLLLPEIRRWTSIKSRSLGLPTPAYANATHAEDPWSGLGITTNASSKRTAFSHRWRAPCLNWLAIPSLNSPDGRLIHRSQSSRQTKCGWQRMAKRDSSGVRLANPGTRRVIGSSGGAGGRRTCSDSTTVRISTSVRGCAFRIERVACNPSMPGSLRTVITISGADQYASQMASSPVAASPQISKPSAPCSNLARSWRTISWSSTRSRRALVLAVPSAPLWVWRWAPWRARLFLSSQRQFPFDANPLYKFGRGAPSLIDVLERQLVVFDVHAHRGPGMGMPMNICQTFLHHAEERNLRRVRQAAQVGRCFLLRAHELDECCAELKLPSRRDPYYLPSGFGTNSMNSTRQGFRLRSSRANVTDRLNRRGPALPGLT